jgi:hypothetical protein
MKAMAARREIPWSLTYEQWSGIVARPCVYRIDSLISPDSVIRTGIDRIDSSLGYTVENTQPCCAAHNMLKGEWLTHEQALDIITRNRIPCQNTKGGRKLMADLRVFRP